jgi:phosphatidate cytidylyltransferase
MLRQRVITSIIAVPILLALLFFQNPWFPIGVTVVALFAGFEFYRIVREMGVKPNTYLSLFVILLLTIAPFCPVSQLKPVILTLAVIVTLVWQIITTRNSNAFSDWVWTVTGIVYVGWTISFWNELTLISNGYAWILWTIATVIFCDVAAFFVGRSIGKHRMAAIISPNKTWEGAVGGIFGSIAASVITGFIVSLPVPWWQMVLAGIVISILAQFGDLAESLLKRNARVKDSGSLLPGHGGVLDRIDSFILIGAIVYYYASFITGK